MEQVTLSQMLQARERRADCQREMLTRHHLPIVSFTLNIPGPVKRNPLIERAYQRGLALLRARFLPECVQERVLDTGCEALLCVRGDPAALKGLAVGIEDADELGRLFDVDVLDAEGRQVSREALGLPARPCLLCGAPAHACARSRAHDVQALFDRAMHIIRDAFARDYADRLSSFAQRALLYEVAATPKPGLVDRLDSGSHRDMDIFTFLSSAAALGPYLRQCALLGIKSSARAPHALFAALVEPGMRAEQAMYGATGGVNAHKGAIYSMGLACAAAGRLYGLEIPFTPQAALSLCADMTRDAAQCYFDRLTPQCARTTGERLYLLHGLKGVRGEAAEGFPSVLFTGLPALEAALGRGLSINDAACEALLHLMAAVPDTVLIGRCSYAAWQHLSRALKDALPPNPPPDGAYMEALNRAYVKENLSPGGSADLLALTLFMHFCLAEH